MIDYEVDVFELAACRGLDPEVWFPVAEPGTALYARDVAVAKAVCAVCPVRAECLAFALDVEHPKRRYGVYGGLDPAERDALVRTVPVAV